MRSRSMIALFDGLLLAITAFVSHVAAVGGQCPPWGCGMNGPDPDGTHQEIRFDDMAVP